MVALLIATAVSALVAVFGTALLIRFFEKRHIGQQIRDDGPQGHHVKAGTPTMGGIAIVGAVVLGYLSGHLDRDVPFTRAGVLVVLLIVGTASIGFLDDWIKISRQRNLGLSKKAKTAGLILVFLTFAIAAVQLAKVRTEVSFLGPVQGFGIDLVPWIFVVWLVLVLFAEASAVNLSDGLDGLAAGSAMYSFCAFVFIGYWQLRHPSCYDLGPALDLSLVAASLTGACAGFLWWNAAPAKIFMGDTGSLAIGAGLGGLALTMNTHLLLPIVGGLFTMVAASVVVQVAVFRLSGRRVFRMAPIHHHFELKGWPETTVIIRFWILAAAMTALAVGLFYSGYLRNCGLLDTGVVGG